MVRFTFCIKAARCPAAPLYPYILEEERTAYVLWMPPTHLELYFKYEKQLVFIL